MEVDPHTIHHIVDKIKEQLRCPQCGRVIPVDWGAIQLAADNFILLELHCEACNAHIVLHAALQEGMNPEVARREELRLLHASSFFARTEVEVRKVQEALEQAGGSFAKMFGDNKGKVV